MTSTARLIARLPKAILRERFIIRPLELNDGSPPFSGRALRRFRALQPMDGGLRNQHKIGSDYAAAALSIHGDDGIMTLRGALIARTSAELSRRAFSSRRTERK